MFSHRTMSWGSRVLLISPLLAKGWKTNYRTVRCISFTRSFSLCIRNAYPIRLSDHAQTFFILKFLSLESSCVKFSIHSWFTTKSSILLRFFSVGRTNRKKIESEALEMVGELQDCIYVAHFISNFEQFERFILHSNNFNSFKFYLFFFSRLFEQL